MRGGAIPHGPKTATNHTIQVPKKVRRAALKMALTRRLEDEALWVLDKVELAEAKTRNVQAIVNAFGWGKVLLVLAEGDDTISRCARNIPGVLVLPVEGLNVYDILRHKDLAFTQGALDALQARLGS
jgi:large subunit ribosomal protein L4